MFGVAERSLEIERRGGAEVDHEVLRERTRVEFTGWPVSWLAREAC